MLNDLDKSFLIEQLTERKNELQKSIEAIIRNGYRPEFTKQYEEAKEQLDDILDKIKKSLEKEGLQMNAKECIETIIDYSKFEDLYFLYVYRDTNIVRYGRKSVEEIEIRSEEELLKLLDVFNILEVDYEIIQGNN